MTVDGGVVPFEATEIADTGRVAYLTPRQLSSFEENGFLVVEDVLDRDQVVAPLIREYEELARVIGATWGANGECDPGALGVNFEEWVTAAYRSGLDYFQPMDISLPAGETAPLGAGFAPLCLRALDRASNSTP